MSSHQEEKQRRSAERLAKEQAEAAAAARKRRLGLVAAGVLGAAAVAAVIVAISAAGGGGDNGSNNASADSGIPNKPVLAQKIADLDAAAKAAGCTLEQIVKAIVVMCDGKPVVALVPGNRRADLDKIPCTSVWTQEQHPGVPTSRRAVEQAV